MHLLYNIQLCLNDYRCKEIAFHLNSDLIDGGLHVLEDQESESDLDATPEAGPHVLEVEHLGAAVQVLIAS